MSKRQGSEPVDERKAQATKAVVVDGKMHYTCLIVSSVSRGLIKMLDTQRQLLQLLAQYLDMRAARNLTLTNKRFRTIYIVAPLPLPPGFYGAQERFVGALGDILPDRESEARAPVSSLSERLAHGFFSFPATQRTAQEFYVQRRLFQDAKDAKEQPTGSQPVKRLLEDTKYVRAVAPFDWQPVPESVVRELLTRDTHLHSLDLTHAGWLLNTPEYLLCDILSKWSPSLRWLSLRDLSHGRFDLPTRELAAQLCVLAQYAPELGHLRHLDLSGKNWARTLNVRQPLWLVQTLARLPRLDSFVFDVDSIGILLESGKMDTLLDETHQAILKRKAKLDRKKKHAPPSKLLTFLASSETPTTQLFTSASTKTTGNWDALPLETTEDMKIWSVLDRLDPDIASRMRHLVQEHGPAEHAYGYIHEHTHPWSKMLRTQLPMMRDMFAAGHDETLRENFFSKHPLPEEMKAGVITLWEHPSFQLQQQQLQQQHDAMGEYARGTKWQGRCIELMMQAIVDHSVGWQRLTLPSWSSLFTSNGQFCGAVMRKHAATLQTLQVNGHAEWDLEELLDTLHDSVPKTASASTRLRAQYTTLPRLKDRAQYTTLPRLKDLSIAQLSKASGYNLRDLLLAAPNLECFRTDDASHTLLRAMDNVKIRSLAELQVGGRLILDLPNTLARMLTSNTRLVRVWLPTVDVYSANRVPGMSGEDYVRLLRACTSRPTHWFVDRQVPYDRDHETLAEWRDRFEEHTAAILNEFRQWTHVRELILPMCLDLARVSEWTTSSASSISISSPSAPWWPDLRVLSFNMFAAGQKLSSRALLGVRNLVKKPETAVLQRFLLSSCSLDRTVQVRFLSAVIPPSRPLDGHEWCRWFVGELDVRKWCYPLVRLQLRLHKQMQVWVTINGQSYTPLNIWTQVLFFYSGADAAATYLDTTGQTHLQHVRNHVHAWSQVHSVAADSARDIQAWHDNVRLAEEALEKFILTHDP